MDEVETIRLESANFSSDTTCQVLADFIMATRVMSFLDIEYQDAERPIKIDVVTATNDGVFDGKITISDYDTGDVIIEQASDRTFYLIVNYGEIGQPTGPMKDKPIPELGEPLW